MLRLRFSHAALLVRTGHAKWADHQLVYQLPVELGCLAARVYVGCDNFLLVSERAGLACPNNARRLGLVDWGQGHHLPNGVQVRRWDFGDPLLDPETATRI